MLLYWQKDNTNHWFTLDGMDVRRAGSVGVYIIWCAEQRPCTIRVGIGWPVSDELKAERCDPRVMRHQRKGDLFVTWAYVVPARLEGVEFFLDSLLRPLVRSRLPNCLPTSVNLPASFRETYSTM